VLALPNLLPVTAQPAAVQAAFNARFQQVTVHPTISRELFNLLVPESLGFTYYQSFPVAINTDFATHTQYILSALPGCVQPIYLEDERSDFVITEHCPAADNSTWPMNEMCAVYLSMFFMGSLVRYRPDLLEELLGTSAAWLLESFVNAAPLLFLRTITCLILNRMILFNR
jgi:YaaC-like protein